MGLAVLDTLKREHLMERARTQGAYLRGCLLALQQRHEAIGDVRGAGLLLGVELVQDRATKQPFHELGALTTQRCFELGLSMNIRRRPERGSVWRIAPPLTVSNDEIDRAVAILDQALTESQDALAARRKGRLNAGRRPRHPSRAPAAEAQIPGEHLMNLLRSAALLALACGLGSAHAGPAGRGQEERLRAVRRPPASRASLPWTPGRLARTSSTCRAIAAAVFNDASRHKVTPDHAAALHRARCNRRRWTC